MIAKGKFKVVMKPEPPFDDVDGVTLARALVDKEFEGPLAAKSTVHMIGVRTKAAGSAAYVAVERISGVLEGKRGTFVITHVAAMSRGGQNLLLSIAPDSGTGELTAIEGRMDIQIVEGQHYYELEYRFAG